jgi:hypothetical protein
MAGPKMPTHRELIMLPVGFEGNEGEVIREAEVRVVTGADEFYIGMSPEYNRNPNDLVYKTLLLARTVTRLGEKKSVSLHDIQKLHAKDVRALEYAVYRLTYGEESLPPEDQDSPGG